MTREEVIKALSVCSDVGCSGCPYYDGNEPIVELGKYTVREVKGDCQKKLLEAALRIIEQDREKELSAPTETVVKYKIVNREDILSEFHELIFSHVNFFMDAKDENSKSDALSMIIGAAILTHNLLNPKIKEEKPNA